MSKSMVGGLKPTHPGEVLREIVLPAVKPNKTEIARLLGISRQHLYDLVGERTPVTARVALRLARLFGGTAETWLRLQEAYDLRTIEPLIADELAEIKLLAA